MTNSISFLRVITVSSFFSRPRSLTSRNSTSLVTCDLLLELIDCAFQRPHGEFAYMLVLRCVVAKRFISRLQPFQFGACVCDFCFVFQIHKSTSIIPFLTPIRSVPKVTVTYSSNSDCPTIFTSRKGKPSPNSSSAAASVGNPRPINNTQSTSFGSIISVTKLPFKTTRRTPDRFASLAIHFTDSICTRRSSELRPNRASISSNFALWTPGGR